MRTGPLDREVEPRSTMRTARTATMVQASTAAGIARPVSGADPSPLSRPLGPPSTVPGWWCANARSACSACRGQSAYKIWLKEEVRMNQASWVSIIAVLAGKLVSTKPAADAVRLPSWHSESSDARPRICSGCSRKLPGRQSCGKRGRCTPGRPWIAS